MIKRKVFLIRHGESEFNYEYEKSNFTIIPTMFNPILTEKGIKQSQLLGKTFCTKLDLIITSPLQRCILTLKHSNLLQQNGLKNPIMCELCREVRECNGDFFEEEEIKLEYDDEEIKKRCKEFVNFIQSLDSKFQTLAVFTHSNFIWHMTSKLGKDGDLYGKWIGNAEWIDVEI